MGRHITPGRQNIIFPRRSDFQHFAGGLFHLCCRSLFKQTDRIQISHYQYIFGTLLQGFGNIDFITKMISHSSCFEHRLCTMARISAVMQNYHKMIVLYFIYYFFYIFRRELRTILIRDQTGSRLGNNYPGSSPLFQQFQLLHHGFQ